MKYTVTVEQNLKGASYYSEKLIATFTNYDDMSGFIAIVMNSCRNVTFKIETIEEGE